MTIRGRAMEKFKELTEMESMDIDGGIARVPVIIMGGCVVATELGFYNGYKSK